MFFALVVAVSLFLSAVVFVVFSFIAKCNALAELKKLPGPKASALFGNALQMQGEVHGKFKIDFLCMVRIPWWGCAERKVL